MSVNIKFGTLACHNLKYHSQSILLTDDNLWNNSLYCKINYGKVQVPAFLGTCFRIPDIPFSFVPIDLGLRRDESRDDKRWKRSGRVKKHDASFVGTYQEPIVLFFCFLFFS